MRGVDTLDSLFGRNKIQMTVLDLNFRCVQSVSYIYVKPKISSVLKTIM